MKIQIFSTSINQVDVKCPLDASILFSGQFKYGDQYAKKENKLYENKKNFYD